MSFPKFASPKCSYVIDNVSQLALNDPIVSSTINNHIASQVIHVISSDSRVINQMSPLIASPSLSYCLIKHFPLIHLTDRIFINSYVLKGKLNAIAINTFNDSFSLLSNGHLIISLSKRTYHRFGMIGRRSIVNGKCINDNYMIEIDLLSDKFVCGTKHYDRFRDCLKRSELTFDMIIKWEITDKQLINESISERSIINYFKYLKSNSPDLSEMQINECAPLERQFTNVKVPIPLSINGDMKINTDDMKDMIEWIGAQICQINCNELNDNDISTFGFSNAKDFKDISCIEMSGFFTPNDALKFITKINELHKNDEFTAIVVNGFDNSVISWFGKNNEHRIKLSGENLYGIAFNGNEYMIWRIGDEFDYGIERL